MTDEPKESPYLDKDEYTALQTLLVSIRVMLEQYRLDKFLATLNKADTVSWIVDPTLTIRAADAVRKVRELAQAFRRVQECELPEYAKKEYGTK